MALYSKYCTEERVAPVHRTHVRCTGAVIHGSRSEPCILQFSYRWDLVFTLDIKAFSKAGQEPMFGHGPGPAGRCGEETKTSVERHENTILGCRLQLKCDGTREGKWRGNWRMEWVASTYHTTSEHGVSSITTADTHTSAVPVVYWTDTPGWFYQPQVLFSLL